MIPVKRPKELSKERAQIAHRVRTLRHERNWTQAYLAKHLHLSQNRLSEIERGDGSFTAEQFLQLLKLFNVPISQFSDAPSDAGVALQNALARFGALHMHESIDALPNEALDEVHDVVREALLDGSPRIITAIAPVLVRNARRLNLNKLHADLENLGRERRLAWVTDNTRDALHQLASSSREAKAWSKLARRAALPLELFLDFVEAPPSHPLRLDVLDANIRSKRTITDVQRNASNTSKRWGIVTSLQPEDFIQALEAARAAD